MDRWKERTNSDNCNHSYCHSREQSTEHQVMQPASRHKEAAAGTRDCHRTAGDDGIVSALQSAVLL
jgi:hypothetical protein